MRALIAAAVVLAGAVGCTSERTGEGEGGGLLGASGTGMMGAVPGSMSMVAVSPVGGAQGVPTGASIDIQFAGFMPASVPGQVDLHVGDLSGPVVPISCLASASGTRLTCTPLDPLRRGTTYVTHLGGGTGLGGYCGSMSSMMGGLWMGGLWVGGGSMTGTHGGMGWSGMGSWADGCGGYGVAFPFTTS